MNQTLRILTIGHSYCIAMNRAVVREIARDPEFEITVGAPRHFHGDLRPIEIEPEPPGSPLKVVPLGTRWSRYIHVFRYDSGELHQLIRETAFDLAHAWEEPYIYAGYQIAEALKDHPAKFSFWTAQNYVKRYPPPFGYFERSVLARAQGWIACASLVFDTMLQRGYPKKSGKIVSLAVDTSEFRSLSNEARAKVLGRLGLRPPVIGFMGRLTRDKGLDVLMQAMEKIGSAQAWNLLLLGGGEYQEKIERWAARNGWQDRLKIALVKHSEVPAYLGAMDLLVAPSQTMKNWREQFGRMLVEAFASGVPVIGSDSGEIPFVIGDAGIVISESDVSAWAEGIQHLLQSAQAREDLKRRGLARAQQYSMASIAQQYKDYYRWLAGLPTAVPAMAGKPDR